MKSKLYFLLALLAASTVILSCSDDDDDDDNGPSYSFTDQTMQGEIGGEAWTIKSGAAEINYWDTTKLSVSLYNIDSDTPCDISMPIYADYVHFSFPVEVGLYELGVETETAFQSITIYDESEELSIGVFKGAVEILTIDEANGVVTGRIDGRDDALNYVNGNFTAVYCQELK